MELSDGEIANVDMVGALKRGHPTMDESSTTNSHSTRLLQDSKKVRSKLSDSGTSVERVSRVAVNPKIITLLQCANKDVSKGDKNNSGNASTVKTQV